MQAQPAYQPYLKSNLAPRGKAPQEQVRQLLLVTARQWGVRAMAQQAAAVARPCWQAG
ncbi:MULTISPECIES: hypothetical protein [Comamonas]|uniref:hypothetical protein n=1 Tax=Comamonas TaxID=283 RepID=UPI00244C7875|nr:MULTISPECIES: hypothetical protein [Comamonas]MDH0048819.1 hypothetical protein [Comamonas terrigena]MDH0511744.1 hypothetical protein [Comamonas terrigena]MDH1091075.1 hypothetical protein [Comamonas terrigena]MDH1500980.1 hypothetical protein [Comamonas terrigena]MDH1700509.1 hypothetical protein [Comamonas terrigena]